jgi:hypothetical protein
MQLVSSGHTLGWGVRRLTAQDGKPLTTVAMAVEATSGTGAAPTTAIRRANKRVANFILLVSDRQEGRVG